MSVTSGRLAGLRPGRTRLDARYAHGQWADTPTLTWMADQASGAVRLEPVPDAAAGPASAIADPALWSEKLRPHIEGNGHKPFRTLEVLPDTGGTLHHFLVIGFPLGATGARHPGLGGVAIDVTRYQQRLDELAHQALEDELTGLYNLRGFLLFAEHEMKVARRRGTVSAIVYADVDGMKGLNDARGHEEGNAALAAAALLLRQVFRECDVIARLGGDEFAVFASDVRGDPDQLRRRLAERLLDAGLLGAGGLSLSVGIAVCPPDAEMRLAELLAAADRAMYKDKFGKLASPAGDAG